LASVLLQKKGRTFAKIERLTCRQQKTPRKRGFDILAYGEPEKVTRIAKQQNDVT
jgi:hypothetical protein